MAGRNVPFSLGEVKWQDYRATQTGMVVYYASDPVSEIPIREIPEDIGSPVPPEPHYETGTYGLYACTRARVRAAFVKNKVRYLFFVTKYEGASADYRGKYLITGMYRIARIADVRRYHIRYCREYECLDAGACLALLADKVHFVSLKDAYEVTSEVLKEWNYSVKLTRQTRIVLDAVHTKMLLEYLESKPSALKSYLDETIRLQPHGTDEGSEGEEEYEEEGQESVADDSLGETAVADEACADEPLRAEEHTVASASAATGVTPSERGEDGRTGSDGAESGETHISTASDTCDRQSAPDSGTAT